MLEFETIETLKPNAEILEAIKDYTFKVKKGIIKHLLHTNLQVIKPTEYIITHPITLTILEYKGNEISNKPFYIKEHNRKYTLKEIIQILKKLRLPFIIFISHTSIKYILSQTFVLFKP